MNLQSRRTNTRQPVKRRNGKEQKSQVSKLCVVLYLLMVILVLFGALNYRIDLNRKINNMERAYNRTQQEIFELDRDIQALKVAHEDLSDPKNIRRRMAEYRLPLRESEPQQVRFFTVSKSPRPAARPLSQTARNRVER
jgi:hypothetical protein